MKAIFHIGYMVLISALLWQCEGPFQTAGGTSDTENAVALTGQVLTPDGQGAVGKTVLIRRSDYLSSIPTPGDSGLGFIPGKAITDKRGRFSFDSLQVGNYVLEAKDGDLATLFKASISSLDTQYALTAQKLSTMGIVTGTLTYRPETYRVFTQIYGLERLVPVDMATGRFSLSLPNGNFKLRFVDPEMAEVFVKTRDVFMTSGQNVTLGTLALRSPNDSYFGWKRSSEIIINTTSSGAGTSQDLIGFPLLVHLDSTNFNFLQALPSGADIRFSKTDGKTALPYEIERWDAVTHKADIWVRVDTLKANSRNQGLIMFWGNSVATDSSTSGAIFDTSLGFSAVYHLGEAAAIQPNGFKDATANKNHGTGISLTTTSSMQGIIGKGQFFNGNSQFIEVPDSPSLKLGVRDFTLSAWVRADTLSHNHQIASKRTIVPADFEFQLMQNGTIAVYPSNDSLGPDGFESRSRVGTADWHYIVFTRQGLLHSIYLDGVLDTADTIFMHDVASSANLRIGQDLDGMEEYWNGMIDDLTISVRARSADWIKMCYKNQLPGNTILEFKR